MELNGRKTDAWGNVIFNVAGLVQHLLCGGDLGGLVAEGNEVEQFNLFCKTFDHPEDSIQVYREPDVSIQEWDALHQMQWFTPEPYASMDVREWLLERCSTSEQVERVELEWQLFQERNMEDVLRFLVYLITSFRERGILWGVGRGSSIASFSLYLIGVHRIDSLAWDLDPREFLK